MARDRHSLPPTQLGRFESAAGFADYAENADLELRNQAIRDLLDAADRSWLDVGCGPGIAARALASTGRQVWSGKARPGSAGGEPAVTVEVPAALGVPEINPVAVLRESPAGRPVAPKLVGLLVAVI